MKREKLFLTSILIIGIAILIFSISNISKENIGTDVVKDHSKLEFETKSSESTVSVDITPLEFEDGKLYVDIKVNTHSVELSKYDLKEITSLEFEGNSIKPISAPAMEWHHNSGTLVFDVGKELKEFTIKIKGLPDIEERVFSWP